MKTDEMYFIFLLNQEIILISGYYMAKFFNTPSNILLLRQIFINYTNFPLSPVFW